MKEEHRPNTGVIVYEFHHRLWVHLRIFILDQLVPLALGWDEALDKDLG